MSFVLRNSKYSVTVPRTTTFSVDHRSDSESSGFSVYRPITYDRKLEYELIKLSNANYPRFSLDNIPSKYSLDIRTGLARVWISLRAYFESSKPILQKRAIELAISKNGAKTLKRIRWKSLMETIWRSHFCDKPDWYDDPEITTYEIYDVGDIYYYKYCFPWEEECDDYKYAFIPVVQRKKTLKKFREKLGEILDSWNFDIEIELEEILYSMSTSKVLLDNGETGFLYSNKNIKDMRFSTKRSPGLRSVVFVSPEGTRDTIINKPTDLYTIKAIDKILLELLYKNCKEVLMDKNSNAFIERYRTLYSDNALTYCRDIQKEGITKPRNLLKIMLEELKSRTKLFDFVNADFYDGEWLSFDGKTPANTKRGHGLGMANALTTLMQIVIFDLVIAKFYKHEFSNVEITPLFLNDDCIFFFKHNTEICSVFEEYDDTILSELGLIRNKSKSFSARGGVFCECFLPPPCDTKESFKRRECLLPLTATNITHAKSMFTLINLEFIDSYYQEIVHKFGYEFYPNEHEFTPEFGGWIPFKINRLNTDLLRMEDIYEGKYAKAYFACQQRTLITRKQARNVPINNYLGIDFHTDQDICKKLNVDTLSNLQSKFYIPFYDPNSDEEWKKLYRKRRKTYINSPSLNFREFVSYVLKNSINFYPPDFAVERKVFVDLYEDVNIDYYDYNAPICSALRSLRGKREDYKPSTLWFLMKEHSDEYLEHSNIRKILVTLNLENFVNIFEREYNEGLCLPQTQEDLEDLEKCYARPFDITYFAFKLDRLVPILKEEFRGNFDMRKECFGRNLNLYEIRLLNDLPRRIVQFFVDKNLSEEILEKALIEFNRLRQLVVVDEYIPEIVEEEDDFDWSTIVRTKERPYVVYEDFSYYENPTEEELNSYLLDNIFINNVNLSYRYSIDKAPVARVLRLFLERNMISSNLEELVEMREKINQELIDLTMVSYPDIYTFLFQSPELEEVDEEEVDFEGDFDMFG